MDNKLSELSKPVAWIIGEESIEEFKRGYETFVVRGDDVDSTEETMKLYSQEYVSALDEIAQHWIGESAGWKKRAEDAEKRIAELEAKLATPIKIVNYDEFFICHVSGASDDYCKGWVDGRNAAARDVGKAGFTVEDRQ